MSDTSCICDLCPEFESCSRGGRFDPSKDYINHLEPLRQLITKWGEDIETHKKELAALDKHMFPFDKVESESRIEQLEIHREELIKALGDSFLKQIGFVI